MWILVSVITIINIGKTFSQEKLLNFFHLDYEEGLSDNHVSNMAIDHQGFLWIGTVNGLNRYDGYSFKVFKHNPNDSTSIPNNRISCLLVTSKGIVYIGTTYGGICMYNATTKAFETLPINRNKAELRETIINDIEEDIDQNIWVSTNKGLYFKKHDSEEYTLYSNSSGLKPAFLLSDDIAQTESSPAGGVWMAFSSKGLVYYNPKNKQIKKYTASDYPEYFKDVVFTDLMAEKNTLWATTINKGTLELDIETGVIKRHLFDNVCYGAHYIFKDSRGIYWICSSDGLVSFNRKTGQYSRFINEFENTNSLSSTPVTSILEDKDGLLWVGSVNGGVNYTQRNKPFNHYYLGAKGPFSLNDPAITALSNDIKGNLWLGYDKGGAAYFDFANNTSKYYNVSAYKNPNYNSGSTFAIFEDSRKQIWLGAWQSSLQKLNELSGRFEIFKNPITNKVLIDWSDIRDIAEDFSGNLWACLQGKGLAKINTKTWEVNLFQQSDTAVNAICGNWVFDVCIDTKNRKWVASSWGISRISSDEKTIKTYRKERNNPYSLIHNNVNAIYCDKRGRVWIGTAEGLNIYDEDRDCFVPVKMGGKDFVENVKAIVTDNKGDIWISTGSGLVKIEITDRQNTIPTTYTLNFYNYADGLQSIEFMPRAATIQPNGTMFFGGSRGIDFFQPEEIKNTPFRSNVQLSNILIFNQPFNPEKGKTKSINNISYTVLNYRQNAITFEYVAPNFLKSDKVTYKYKLEGLDTAWNDVENRRTASFAYIHPGKYTFKVLAIGPNNVQSQSEALFNFYIKPPFWDTLLFKIAVLIFLIGAIVAFTNIRIAFFKRIKTELEHTVAIRTEEIQQMNQELLAQSDSLNETNIILMEKQNQIEEQSEELQIQSEQLSKTNNELKLINQTKDKLFSIIAHDLKNPFNIILGFSELLVSEYKNRKPEENLRIATLIKESAISAYQLLENLLYWSKSQRQMLNAQPEVFDLKNIMEEISLLYKEQMVRKELEHDFQIDKNTLVFADINMVNTVIRNLLANAIKFTPKKGSIHIKALPLDNFIQVAISDSGVGIRVEKLDTIFSPDASYSEKGTEGEQGTGLGLVICKEFVEKNSGKLWVESEPGKGSTFYFTVPAKVSKEEDRTGKG